MMAPFTVFDTLETIMNVYIYAADIYCEDCGKAIQNRISHENPRPASEWRPAMEYPQGPYPDGGGESDSPQHCAEGANCPNAIELDDGCKVGAWLENELTEEGIKYIRRTKGTGKIAALWIKWYSNLGYIL